MKVLALVGSSRKGENTDLLVDQMIKATKTKGHTTEKLYLCDYTISLCADCRHCKKGDNVCGNNDEMQKIYPRMEETDVIIFGTPIYWYGTTAKMKKLLDKMRLFVENKKLRGKKAVVDVAPSAEGAKACEPMLEMFRQCFEYLNIEFVDKVFAKAYAKAEVATNQTELYEAFSLRAAL